MDQAWGIKDFCVGWFEYEVQMGTLSSKWFKICSRERFGIELCIGSPPQEYMLVEAIDVDEIKQEKE